MNITSPDNYQGSGPDGVWKVQDDVHIVNGIVDKCDGTFYHEFKANEIGEKAKSYNLLLGPYLHGK